MQTSITETSINFGIKNKVIRNMQHIIKNNV
jgi:hypothetical protein